MGSCRRCMMPAQQHSAQPANGQVFDAQLQEMRHALH